MEPEQDLAEYRERLLGSIRAGSRKSACTAADSIQVFVNQRRVGSMDGGGGEATLQVQSEVRVDSVQLRSEDGVLLGALSAPEYGFRATRISFQRDVVELQVQNFAEGGSVCAAFIPAPSFWHRARRAFTGFSAAAAPRPAAVVPGMRALMLMQAAFAVVLVGLAADRYTGWATPAPRPLTVTPTEAPWAAPLTEMAKLEKQLAELSRMQTKVVDTIQTQQNGMVQLQKTMTDLASTQELVASRVVTVKREIEQRQKATGRDIDRVARILMGKVQNDQQQMEAEIHSLTVANERLSNELTQLHQNNLDLKKRLKSAGEEVSKFTEPDRAKPLLALQKETAQTPPLAEAPSASAQSFQFWVTFSDGTTEESIDQWVHDMRGHKGALTDGWQAVQIQTPSEPMERFLDQIKHAKIVKAVRISR